MNRDLTLFEPRELVGEMLERPRKLRLVQIRIKAEIFEMPRNLAPDGDMVKLLLRQTVEN